MDLNSQNFSELVLESDKPVIVEFMWNDSLLCKLMQDRVNRVPEMASDDIEYLQVDIYKNSDLRESFRIKDIPTFFFYYRGKIIQSTCGLENEYTFGQKVRKLIGFYLNINLLKRDLKIILKFTRGVLKI